MRWSKDRSVQASAHGPRTALEVSDAVLARLTQGDIGALDEIFGVYGGRVFSVCYGILGNRIDAEDASQEVFLRAFEQAGKFAGRSRYSTWLLRLATNLTLNRAKAATRRRRISETLAEDAVSAEPGPEHGAMVRERQDSITGLLQQVPLQFRQVLVLREMEGLSYAEMAEILCVPVGTVTSRLIRGREKLRDLVRQSGIDPNFSG